MAAPDEIVQSSALPATEGDISLEEAHVDTLHLNAIGLPAVMYYCFAGAAPMAAMFFNVPNMASQAGASVPLVFLFSSIGLLLFGVTLVYFSRRLSSAGGFYTWISHGLGRGAAFQGGWLMLGGYAVFEAASQAAFGGLTDLTLSTYLHFSIPGGWVTYALIGTALVFILSYFDIKWSVWWLAPFLILEIGSLVLLNLVISLKGGVAGHDFVHTFTTAGSALKGVSPGGVLGIGVAMALGVWSFIGFESGTVYGEESHNPRRVVPIAVFTVVAAMSLLYIWTTYSAIIGLGWQHAGDVLGNIANAPLPYYNLADTFVGGWLKVLMIIAVSTSTFSACLAFHQAMVRYFYAMGREGVLHPTFGKTHPHWKSPLHAIIAQSVFTALVILFLSLVIQKSNPDGSVSFALGFADGKIYTQTNGIGSYAWLAIIGTINFILVYILVNIAASAYAWRHDRGNYNVLSRLIAPVLSSLILLVPLVSFVFPAIPGAIGNFFTGLGFFPTPFPLNILPIFVLIWLVVGIGYAYYLSRSNPEAYQKLGHILRTQD